MLTYGGLRNAALFNYNTAPNSLLQTSAAMFVCMVDALEASGISADVAADIMEKTADNIGNFHTKYKDSISGG